MKLLNHELKLSISLDEKTYVNAKAFAAAGLADEAERFSLLAELAGR